jgi:dihydroflavonol-4-reductase
VKALVTGGAGFLGRHLVRELLARGTPTIALSRRPAGLAELHHPALTVIAADVREADTTARALDGVDTVFHLAALRNRPGGSAAEFTAINELATLRLAGQCRERGVRKFVHASTALVFGSSSAPLDEGAPLVASGPSTDVGAYTLSKARAVAGLRRLACEGAPIVVLHPTIVFGPDHPSAPNRVTSYLRRTLRRRFAVAVDGGDAPRDLVYVDDVVAAFLAAAERAMPGDEFLVAGEAITQRELGETAARLCRRRRPLLVSAPMSLARLAGRMVDRARGWEPATGLEAAIGVLARPWTFDGSRARVTLDHRPRAISDGLARTVDWLGNGAA